MSRPVAYQALGTAVGIAVSCLILFTVPAVGRSLLATCLVAAVLSFLFGTAGRYIGERAS